MNVSTRTPGPSGGRKRVTRPRRRREVVRRILGVDAQLDHVPGARPAAAAVRELLPRRDPHLLAHEVDRREELRHGMLDLEARVHLDERERAVRADEELDRAGVAVADVLARALGGGLHLLAQLVAQRGRRRLLDELLVAALDRALALAAREDGAVVVAEHLDLDVARRRDDLLDVHRPVAERRQRLGGGALVELADVGGLLDAPHAAPAAARRRLEEHRIAELVGGGARLVRPGDPSMPGTSGTPAARISAFARALSPIRSITSAGGPMKTRSFSSHARTKSAFSERKP